MLWQLRPPQEDDVPFIFSSALKTHRQSMSNVEMGNDIYFSHMHAALEKTIRGDQTHIVIACAPGEDGVIFGYGVAELFGTELCLHLIYAKHSFRNFGLGKALEAELLKLPHDVVTFSCSTKLAKSLNRKRNYHYNPWRLWARGAIK